MLTRLEPDRILFMLIWFVQCHANTMDRGGTDSCTCLFCLHLGSLCWRINERRQNLTNLECRRRQILFYYVVLFNVASLVLRRLPSASCFFPPAQATYPLWPILGNSVPKVGHEILLSWCHFHSFSKYSCFQGSKNCELFTSSWNFWNWSKDTSVRLNFKLKFLVENYQNQP